MLTRKARRFTVAAWVVVGLTLTVQADTVTLAPSKDNTLIEYFGGTPYSNALGDGIYSGRVGKMGGGLRRRAVLAFDLVGVVPAEAEITSVTLTLNMSMTNAGPETIGLHPKGEP